MSGVVAGAQHRLTLAPGLKDATGKPTGVLLNNAGALLDKAVPQPTPTQLANRVAKALATLLTGAHIEITTTPTA